MAWFAFLGLVDEAFFRFGGCCVGFGWEVWLLGGREGSEVETRGKAAAVFNQLPSSQL